MAVKRRKKVGFNTQVMLDTFIASTIVQIAPKLLNKLIFKDKPLVGPEVIALAGGAVAYGVGWLMENDNIANIGLGLAGADALSETIMPIVDKLGDFVSLPGSYEPVQLNDWTQNNDLTSQSMIQSVMN